MNIKQIILTIVLSSLCLSTSANTTEKFPYNLIETGNKISVSEDGSIWTTKINKKDNYYIKQNDSLFAIDNSTELFPNCSHLFINKGTLIGYSNHYLKFYELTVKENKLNKRELLPEEVKSIFPDFELAKLSEFSKSTNSIKIKKDKSVLKLIIFNDTDKNFEDYSFSSNNAKFESYPISGMLNIKQRGLIEFSHNGKNTQDTPWYILMIR